MGAIRFGSAGKAEKGGGLEANRLGLGAGRIWLGAVGGGLGTAWQTIAGLASGVGSAAHLEVLCAGSRGGGVCVTVNRLGLADGSGCSPVGISGRSGVRAQVSQTFRRQGGASLSRWHDATGESL